MITRKRGDSNVASPTTTGDEAQVVYTFSKNAFQEVRAYLQPYKGQPLAHVRIFSPDRNEVDRPTKQGIAVLVSDLPELAAAVDALLAATGQSRT